MLLLIYRRTMHSLNIKHIIDLFQTFLLALHHIDRFYNLLIPPIKLSTRVKTISYDALINNINLNIIQIIHLIHLIKVIPYQLGLNCLKMCVISSQ